MGGFEIRDLIMYATIIFAAGGIYANISSLKTEFKEFREQMRLTLFGADGRNGMVGDTHILKEHIKGCPFGHGKRGAEHE